MVIMTVRSIAAVFAVLWLHTLLSFHVNAYQRLHPNLDFVDFVIPGNYFPGCGGHAACTPLPIDPELKAADFSTFNLTESQVKAVCRDIRDQTACHLQHTNCVPENLRPLLDPLKLVLTKQMEVCDDPRLYADFQAIKSCAVTMWGKFGNSDHRSPFKPALSAFTVCPYVGMVAGKSGYDELRRVGFFRSYGGRQPWSETNSSDPASVIKQAEILHGLCCAGKAVVGCGVNTLIGETCFSDAVAAIKRQMDNTLNALNCSAITATRPCELVVDF